LTVKVNTTLNTVVGLDDGNVQDGFTRCRWEDGQFPRQDRLGTIVHVRHAAPRRQTQFIGSGVRTRRGQNADGTTVYGDQCSLEGDPVRRADTDRVTTTGRDDGAGNAHDRFGRTRADTQKDDFVTAAQEVFRG
jgi:hypothetical protein